MLWDECRLRVFKSRLLKRIFGSKRAKVTGGQKILCADYELDGLYSLPYIVSMMKLRRMRWACCMACMGENSYRVLVGNPEEITPNL